MIQSPARMTTNMRGVNSQDFRQQTETNLPLASQNLVDLGSVPVSTHNLSAGRALSAMVTAKHHVPATVTTTQQESLSNKDRFLLKEVAEAEERVEKLKRYWAAVAEDQGPTAWADPMNPYRRVWEQEISSASDKLKYLEQIARVPGPDSQPLVFKAREINKVNNRERNALCDHPVKTGEKHASHMRTLKRKATRQRKKAREQMSIRAQSHNSDRHSSDFVSASDTSRRLAQRTTIDTNQSWSGSSRQDCAPAFEDQTVMKAADADAQAGAYDWHQYAVSRRLSETNQAPAREESIEAIQDRLLATLEKELMLPKEIPFLEALVPSPQVENAETEDGDRDPEKHSVVTPKLEKSWSKSRTEMIKNVQGCTLSALELTLPRGSTPPKTQPHEAKAARTVHVGGVPSLTIEDLRILFHAYEV